MTDAAILAAHAAGDGVHLARLYAEAADLLETGGALDAACFFLTQAYIFALEAGSAEAAGLRVRLVEHGREV